MGTIETLRDGGFSDVEIQTHISAEKDTLTNAGFSQDEITEHFGYKPFDVAPVVDLVKSHVPDVKLPRTETIEEEGLPGAKLEQDEPPSTLERFLQLFEPDKQAKAARATMSIVSSEATGLQPSKFEPSSMDALTQGAQQSVSGLLAREAVPETLISPEAMEYMPITSRLLMQSATLAGDLPFMVGGALIGGAGGPLTATGGAFALPQGLRQVLMDKYTKGEVQSFQDFWQRMSDAVIETAKGEITGITTAAAGRLAPTGMALPAEVATMTTVGAGLDGHIPEPKEFLDAALIIGGLRASISVAAKLSKTYAKVGKRPSEVLRDKDLDPTIDQDLASRNIEVPTAYREVVEVTPGEVLRVAEEVQREFVPVPELTPEVVADLKKGDTVSLEEGEFEVVGKEADGGIILENETGRITIDPGEFAVEAEVVPEGGAGEDIVFHGRTNLKKVGEFRPSSGGELGAGVYFSRDKGFAAEFAKPRGEVQNLAEAEARAGVVDLDIGKLNIKQITKEEFIENRGKFYDAEQVLNNGEWDIGVANRAEAKQRASFIKDGFDGIEVIDEKQGVIFPEATNKLKPPIPEEAALVETAEEKVLSRISINEKQKRALPTFTDIYTATVDDLYPLKKIVDKITEGETLPHSEDPYIKARLMRGVAGKPAHFLEYSPFTFATKKNVGKPLKAILTPLGDKLDSFRSFIVSKRAIELNKRGIETGVDLQSAKTVVKEGAAEFDQAFKEVKQYQDHVLKYLKDSGIISDDAFKTMKEANQDYVPFFRVMEDEKITGTGKGLEAFQPTKRIKGSERIIHDPLESIIKNTYLFVELAERNAVGQSILKLEGKPGFDKFVKKIKTKVKPVEIQTQELQKFADEFDLQLTDENLTIFRPNAFMPEENVISVWKGGKRGLYEVDTDIARVMKALDKEQVNTLIKVVAIPAKFLRAGAVLSPEFIGRNPIRDQFSAFIFSKHGYVPGYHLLKGIFRLAKKDSVYQDWIKSGGLNSMLVSMDRKYLQKNLGEIAGEVNVFNKLKNPIEILRTLSEFSEAGTRLGEFEAARKGGAGLEKAGFASREVTLDFAKIGAKTKSVNQLVAFFNANILGTDKWIRSFKEKPAATSAKVAAGITIPSVMLHLANREDGRWDDIPQWQKDLFWIVLPKHVSREDWAAMTPQQQEEFSSDHSIWRIPKPFELGIIFGTMAERAAEFILTKDPKAFDKAFETFARGSAPGTIPTAAVPIIENWANRSIFLDRPIIPANREGILPEYQYKPYTTELAKAMGALLGKLPPLKRNPNIAPVKIENLIRGWSGGLGTHLLNLADMELRKLGVLPDDKIRPTKTLADIPFVKAFVVRHPSAGAENIQKFYDKYFEVRQINKTAKIIAKKDFKFEESAELLGQQEVQLDGTYNALKQAQSYIELINQSATLSPDEKRQLIDVSYFHMAKMAKFGNILTKEIEKISKGIGGPP